LKGREQTVGKKREKEDVKRLAKRSKEKKRKRGSDKTHFLAFSI
jgi:hypothetical protein